MGVLSEAEIEELRWHLGYGNVGIGGYPYTPDGYFELFRNVISEYITTGAETSATTTITANTIAVVTPLSMTDIVPNARLMVDAGDEAEVVVVKAVTATTFTAKFTIAHTAAGYPVAVYSGLARLRFLLHQANKAFFTLTGTTITKSAGLKSVGRGAVEWFQPGSQLAAIAGHYRAIVAELGELVRVTPADTGGRTNTIETY